MAGVRLQDICNDDQEKYSFCWQLRGIKGIPAMAVNDPIPAMAVSKTSLLKLCLNYIILHVIINESN